MLLTRDDAASLVQEIAGGLASSRRGDHHRQAGLDLSFFRLPRRREGGRFHLPQEMQAVAERILLSDDVRTCPPAAPSASS